MDPGSPVFQRCPEEHSPWDTILACNECRGLLQTSQFPRPCEFGSLKYGRAHPKETRVIALRPSTPEQPLDLASCTLWDQVIAEQHLCKSPHAVLIRQYRAAPSTCDKEGGSVVDRRCRIESVRVLQSIVCKYHDVCCLEDILIFRALAWDSTRIEKSALACEQGRQGL